MPHFDLCVIGSGSGNSIVDERFADRSVALIDDGPVFGGTCLNVGCIPSKMFSHPADLAASVRHAADLGVDLKLAGVDWSGIRDRVFGRIDPIAAAGERWRQESSNVTLYRDTARFVAPGRLVVAGEEVTADAFVLAAGSRPVLPDVPGMADEAVRERVHTSDTIMRIDELPRRIVIVGGGSVAVEFAHIFSAFGSNVTVLNRSRVLLSRHDEEVSQRFTELLSRRCAVHGNQLLSELERTASGINVLAVDAKGIEYDYEADLVLIARGRRPNSDRLDAAAGGIAVNDAGYVVVDRRQRAEAPGTVYALGDLCNPLQLKHVANHEARVVQHNLLHPDSPIESDHRFVPNVVFSSPQVATIGATEQELRATGRRYVKVVQPYASVAYGWAMEDDSHFAKLLADPENGRLLGAHIIGPEAASLLQPLIQAMSFALPVRELARGQYWPHPALSEVVENALLALPL